jgi:hypothetical protein
LLTPVGDELCRYVLAASKLHDDDKPALVLAAGTGKAKTGRLWTYVRDGCPSGDKATPAVWLAHSTCG